VARLWGLDLEMGADMSRPSFFFLLAGFNAVLFGQLSGRTPQFFGQLSVRMPEDLSCVFSFFSFFSFYFF
jgi:hypothetical protein